MPFVSGSMPVECCCQPSEMPRILRFDFCKRSAIVPEHGGTTAEELANRLGQQQLSPISARSPSKYTTGRDDACALSEPPKIPPDYWPSGERDRLRVNMASQTFRGRPSAILSIRWTSCDRRSGVCLG